ncbi:protein FAM217A [Pseudorasbora parva]|uniref:protein FAM217A n=1 Tax=Pseudorasbora parva TaxID=51549 RepID=UPI00351E103D
MSVVVNAQQVSLAACISNACMAQEPTTCCSQAKSSQVLKQHPKTQLRMLSHRWQRLGLQPPIFWDTQEHISERRPEVETRTAMEIRPIQVSCTVSSRDAGPDEIKTISNSLNKLLEENLAKQSSSQVSVESENSDLSDQEKDNIPVLKWEIPVELDLRPDSFDRELEPTETGDGEQMYPEVLPFPLKDFDFSQLLSKADHLESQHKLCLSDPCLAAMVARMIKMEKLQTATIQKEQGKAVRSRPATALVRSANRLRQVDSSCSHAEHLRRTKGSNSILDDVTKLTVSANSQSKSMHRNHPSSNAGKVWIRFQQPPALPKKPHSGAVKLKKTEALVHDLNAHSSSSPKCNSSNSFKRCKPTKKAMPKPQKTSSEKTSVPVKAPCRKT